VLFSNHQTGLHKWNAARLGQSGLHVMDLVAYLVQISCRRYGTADDCDTMTWHAHRIERINLMKKLSFTWKF